MKTTKITEIEASSSLVFDTLMDTSLATDWVPSLISYELISETSNIVGAIYKSKLQYNDVVYEQISEIKVLVENEYIQWSATSPFCESNVEYFLSPISNMRTEFKHVSECNYKGFAKIWAWLAKSKLKRETDTMLNEAHASFKALVEMNHQSKDLVCIRGKL